MGRGGAAVLLAAVLAVLLTVPAAAAGELGAIRVTVAPDMADSTVMLSYAGIVCSGGLQLTGEFGGGYVTGQDMQTRELVTWLAEQVQEGIEKTVARDGTVMFTGLPEGVYLLTQKTAAPGYYAIQPMLIRLPEADGSWLAQAYPKLEKNPYDAPQTGQPMTPVLAAMGMVISAFGIGIWYEAWHKNKKK